MQEAAQTANWVLPLTKLERPKKGALTSSRLRHRRRRRMGVWRVATELVAVINALDTGTLTAQTTRCVPTHATEEQRDAWRSAHQTMLREAKCFERRRRGESSTGAHQLARLIHSTAHDQYSVKAASEMPRVTMKAAAIDEPDHERTVDMLNALTERESQYYSCEANVIDPVGKSTAQFEEIESHYAFVAGSHEEYIAYFHRSLPSRMWVWLPVAEVKAYSGFAVVPKKDPSKQRKLLMACAANFMMQDVRKRSDDGLFGGEAICKVHVPSQCVTNPTLLLVS